MKYITILIVIFSISCKSTSQKSSSKQENAAVPAQSMKVEKMSQEELSYFTMSDGTRIEKVNKSEEEWKNELNKQEYYVLREKGTERSFTSPLLENKEKGVYVCGACALPLFSSEAKYKSGTGWPSFYEPVDREVILEDTDYDLGYARTEVMCKRCGGHLGHVFEDGPKPTGLRYCINGVSLDFEKR